MTRPVRNWVKATALLKKHEKSEWHVAAVEKKALCLSSQKHGDLVEQIVAASEEEKKQNRELMKKLIRSLYFLIKNHIPLTTLFEGLITLQIENCNIKLKSHRESCPRSATYKSYATVVVLLVSIGKVLESKILASFKASPYFSVMVDESTDVSSKEELSVCVRWVQMGNRWSTF